MRVSLVLIFVISFLFNGCFFDRVFQKKIQKTKYPKVIIISESKPYTLEEIKKNRIKIKKRKNYKKKIKKTIIKNKKKTEVKKQIKNKKKPHVKKTILKKQKVTKKINTKSSKKIAKVKKYKKKKPYKQRIKKRVFEPYSIEKNEIDPELLGPQSTLAKNPLM